MLRFDSVCSNLIEQKRNDRGKSLTRKTLMPPLTAYTIPDMQDVQSFIFLHDRYGSDRLTECLQLDRPLIKVCSFAVFDPLFNDFFRYRGVRMRLPAKILCDFLIGSPVAESRFNICSERRCLRLIPVRDDIHSSSVSIICESMSFVASNFGKALPVPIIFINIFFINF